MADKHNDFSRIHMTNVLASGFDREANRLPIVSAVLLVVFLGVDCAVIN